MGSLTASEEWFMPWRTISNENDKPQVEFELEKIVRGFFRPDLFDLRPRANPAGDLKRSSMSLRSILDYVRYFILFEEDGGKNTAFHCPRMRTAARRHSHVGQFRDSVRARMRILIRQLLRKYKYPPDGQEEAIVLVLKQAEELADAWTGGM
ncbi:MAG: type I restriction enzyme endonuclease domain-containing protein [Luteolibacter sp.]